MENMKFTGTDLTVSRLGFGCMRLPTVKQGKKRVIHEQRAIDLIRYAIDNGVTYIDTAYPYHDGQSEVIVGKALRDGYRERVTLTTKLPCWNVKTPEDMDRLLNEQLEKLQTDHVDFYLLHAMGKDRLKQMREMGYKEFMDRAVKSGKVRYPGFSFHDDAETFLEILDDYDWKLAQVQMNILDDEAQATVKGIERAREKGVGVVIMEPLRGGLMAKLPPNVQEVYDSFPVKRSGVEWAFRYLYDMPGVMTILSGMSTKGQLKDNLRIFKEAQPNVMDESERKLIKDVKKAYLSRIKTMCTGCRYCQPCPRGVRIPEVFREWDNSLMFNEKRILQYHMKNLTASKNDPSQCVVCGKCEKACPQHLHIIELLKEAAEAAK
ncbi:MAG: aldo/keto reductase [Eubacteriales bacterium]|nr:aldo/keto reductase [Eubacteriales bacterium]MDD3881614.1 aldo/keto reductase [Eubacteriales bacterium]MDD4512327.1 aldo/keto reductase [Eubacteriales bacterium]